MVGAAALLVGGLLASAPAQAISIDFTSCHITAGCGVSPFGTVTVTQDTTTPANVDVSVTLADSNRFVSTGALTGGNAIFAFNGTDITATDIINETSTPTGTPLNGISGTFTGPNGAPNFGTFGFGIDCASCTGGSTIITALSFTVANATVADITQPNANGVVFIADLLIGNVSGNPTGVVDAVPAPVIGHGLLVLLAVGGVLFGGKILENLRDRRLHAT